MALVVLGVVVALGLAAGAVGLTAALRSDPTVVPELPDSVGPVAMTGDPVAANPCALIDPAVMSRFGAVRIGPGRDTGECRATVTAPDGRNTQTDLYYSDVAVEAVRPSAPARDLGGLSVLPSGPLAQGCTTYLRLSDTTLVGIATVDGSTAGGPPNPTCAVTDAATNVAVNRLADAGVTYTPGWQGPISLAGKNACVLAGDVGPVVAGLDGLRRSGFPNGSICYLGRGAPGSPYARIDLGLEPEGGLDNYGTTSTAGGKILYTRGIAGYYAPLACQVYVVHRPFDAGARRPTEFVAARLEGAAPYDQLCSGATGLALLAERNAG